MARLWRQATPRQLSPHSDTIRSMSSATDVPAISSVTLRFFRRIVRGYFQRHFRAVLIQHAEHLRGRKGPFIVYANHASWWDPMVCVLLGDLLLPGLRHYAPMDAVPLARYPILRKVGVFPLKLQSARGAVEFLRTAEAVLRSGGVLWLTPQGRFADVRDRPLGFKPGLAALALRMPDVPVLPLAIEYTFWNERLPETLLHVCEPVPLSAQGGTAAATQRLEEALEEAMQRLQTAAMTRDPLHFDVLLDGSRGTGGFYAMGKRIRAWFGGQRFEEDHSARDRREREARG